MGRVWQESAGAAPRGAPMPGGAARQPIRPSTRRSGPSRASMRHERASHARSSGAVAAAFFTQGLVFISLTTRLPEFTDRWHLTETRLSLLLLMMVLLAGAGSVARGAAGRAPRQRRGAGRRAARGGAGARRSRRQRPRCGSSCWPSRRTAWRWASSTPATNMQAVALEHHYGRTILPSFHGAWTLGGMTGAALTLATAGHSPATLAGALVIAAASLLFLAAGFLPAEEAGPGTGPELAVPWRPIAPGRPRMVCSTWSTPPRRPGARRTSTARSTPRPALVALATFPYLLASGCCGSSATASSRRTARSRCCGRAGSLAAVALAVVVGAPAWPVAVLGLHPARCRGRGDRPAELLRRGPDRRRRRDRPGAAPGARGRRDRALQPVQLPRRAAGGGADRPGGRGLAADRLRGADGAGARDPAAGPRLRAAGQAGLAPGQFRSGCGTGRPGCSPPRASR